MARTLLKYHITKAYYRLKWRFFGGTRTLVSDPFWVGTQYFPQ